MKYYNNSRPCAAITADEHVATEGPLFGKLVEDTLLDSEDLYQRKTTPYRPMHVSNV
jgi:hypothetical protein